MSGQKSSVLSCIQPTGELHLGNYFGAVKNWVEMQEDHRGVYGIVDLHAITIPYEPKELKQNTEQMAIDLLACGIDPEKSILFIQSLVPEHNELAWIFNCLTSYGELTRQTQFKDKSLTQDKQGKEGFISSGLFTYPVLQAADILIYRANYVPVGRDQTQHLELTRNIAERFNHRFGEYFPMPELKLTTIPKVMSTADPTAKMSKSLGEKHAIGLFEEEASMRKKIARAVTDSGDTPEGEISPGIQNLFELLGACGRESVADGFRNDHQNGTLRYKDLKDAVADAIADATREIKARRLELQKDKEGIMKSVRTMSGKAREIASETVREVRKRIGVPAIL